MKRWLLLTWLTMACATPVYASETLSLSGEWRFELVGTNETAFSRDLTGTIRLPGTMDDAGLGPTNTKPAKLDGPYRLYDYAGPAWYQRDIEVPTAWDQKRLTLFLERCRWVTTVWLDERRIGSQDSLISPHVYDLGANVKPGKHRLTICVDNTVKLNLGTFVSALFGGTPGNMNGIIGRIELSATPLVWIDEVQIYPDFDKEVARVVAKIGNVTGKAGGGVLSVGAKSVELNWDSNGGRAEIEVNMKGAKPWDEFAPNLNAVTVKLGEDERTVQFGMRKFAAKGTQFTMNGRPLFLRGTLECSVFPLTGYPPTDVAAWQRIFKILKSYGLNFMRFHSWCPPDAAFTAADIEGVMLQAEGPQANVDAGTDSRRDGFIEAEFKRIVDTYGNHPSFCLMTLGNEYGGKDEVLTRWVDMLIQRDARHLYSSASAAQTTTNRQWTEEWRGRGITGAGTQRDLRDIVAGDPRPTVGHEIGQWMFYPDFNEMKKYSGVMRLKNFELIRDDLQKKHLLPQAPQFVEATGKFAVLLYKEEIEVLLRTAGYAGFSLLDLHDYPTQGTALIGPLDPFWDSKGFIAPEAFQHFCGPSVPLLRLPKRTFTSDETLEGTAELAHYGPNDLLNAQPLWTLKDELGQEKASGKLPTITVPTGGLVALGKIQVPLATVSAPAKLTLSLALRGTSIINAWDIWVYPARPKPSAPAEVVVSEKWDEAKLALSQGKKVILFPRIADPSHALRGRFLPVFWSPVWFPDQKPNTLGLLCDPEHGCLRDFPTESFSNWQWYDLMQRSRVFVLDDTAPEYRPVVQVIDNFARNHKLGVIFEGRMGSGQLLVCGFELLNQMNDPAARQLQSSLYRYVDSPAFKPSAEFTTEFLESLFVPKFKNGIQQLEGKIHADGEAPDYAADQAIDGDPNTMWHTPWEAPAPNFPHELVVEFGKPLKIAGIRCLPRQDGNPNGWIKGYAVYVSSDGKQWGTPVAQGEFPNNAEPHTVPFAQPAEVRFLKLEARSSFDSTKPFASLAELDVVR